MKEHLTSDLAGIGILVGTESTKNPNIENTLLAASIEGMAGDFRTLSLLVDWLDIHIEKINVDRLSRVLDHIEDKKVLCFWKAIGQWKKDDHRLKKLFSHYKGKKINLLNESTEFLLRRHGEDPRFKGTSLRVPAKLLRHRPQDILSKAQLAKTHNHYKYRTIIGPSYRADMWAMLESNSQLSTAELARRTFGSFATAWLVKRDWETIGQLRSD